MVEHDQSTEKQIQVAQISKEPGNWQQVYPWKNGGKGRLYPASFWDTTYFKGVLLLVLGKVF